MIFADPVWLWGILLLVPVLVFKMVNLATKNNKTSNFVAQNLKKLLVHGSNRKIKLIKYIVLSFAFSFILIAMARPQWGHEDQQSFSKGRTVMIAIDASRSMLAEDLTPNRLSRAKLAACDLIDVNHLSSKYFYFSCNVHTERIISEAIVTNTKCYFLAKF